MNWLETIKPFTKRTIINTKDKKILLVHPHFQPGPQQLRNLLKLIKQNPYSTYKVDCVGFASIKGILILKMIQRYLNKLSIVDSTDLKTNIESSIYTLKVKFK